MDKTKDYYEILGLDKSATKDEIKSSFKSLAKKFHPDVNRSHVAIEKFKEINEAYSILSDSELRKEYNKYRSIKIKTEAKKDYCNYYPCQKETLTIICKYCEKFFCIEHITPHPPYSFWDRIKLGIPDNVHPCPDCPPCPYCKKKYHPEPYTNPYTTKVKSEESEPLPKPPKPTLEQVIKRIVEILEKEFPLDHSEVKIITTINRKLPYKEIGSKIVEFISEKSISIVKRNPDSKGVVLGSIDIIKKELSELSDEIFGSANLLYLEKAKKIIEQIKKPSSIPKPTQPKPEKYNSRLFVSQVYNTSFDIGFNNNIRNSLRNLRKYVLRKNTVSEHEIQKILNDLIIILKNNSFERRLDNACYKFVKNIYETYSIDLFSYWNHIYNEAKKETEQPPKWASNKIIKKVAIASFILILLLSLLIYASTSTIKYGEVQNVTSTKAITSRQNVSNKISFSEYTNDVYASENKQATLNGFLRRSIEGNNNAGVHLFSIVDDNNNAIVLDWSYNELKKYLPDVGTTKELYSVKGIFKREYKTLKFNVESISSYQREPVKQVDVTNVVSYTEPITINRTKFRYPLVRNFIFKTIGKEILCEDNTKLDSCSNEKPLYCTISGLRQEPTKCGCPAGKRVYKNECINKVKCQDGTYEPECSKNKPKQCVDGKLVENPEVCGCPEFYKLKDKKCVYIKCSDGTIQPDCSPKLKMQCIEGNFIYNPNKCGCPDGYAKRGNNCVKTCNDGTAYGECSSDKPLYCDDGTFLKKPEVCGCNFGYQSYNGDCVDSNQVESMEATDYLNEIRKKYDRDPVKWDEQLYELALYRTKDMYDRKYFDHVTPDGKCVKDFKEQFGLEDYNIAENAGAVTNDYSDENNVVYASYANVKEQIDGWLESRGHRYNLLYPSHILGVAACYKGACVFLGANKEYYGLGFGPCTTGDEGTAYWETVSNQPGEV